MTTNEYAQIILESQNIKPTTEKVDEAAAYEAAQLVSGSFTLTLFETMCESNYDMEATKQRLESLFDSENHFGLVYFIFILANAVDITVPIQFSEMSANDRLVPFLSSAIIDDWMDYDLTYDPSDYE